MIKIYGIKNCDTVRKALKQLDAQQSQYQFVDMKSVGLSAKLISNWISQQPDTLVNKRSTTYRSVKEELLAVENDIEGKITLIKENPTLIKRPVLEKADGSIYLGYDVELYSEF